MIIEGDGNEVSRNRTFRNADIIVTGNFNAITRNHVSDSRVGPDGGESASFEGGHDNRIARNIVARTSEAGIRLAASSPTPHQPPTTWCAATAFETPIKTGCSSSRPLPTPCSIATMRLAPKTTASTSRTPPRR